MPSSAMGYLAMITEHFGIRITPDLTPGMRVKFIAHIGPPEQGDLGDVEEPMYARLYFVRVHWERLGRVIPVYQWELAKA